MASRVSKTTLISEPWQNVFDLINSNSNVADPVTTAAEFRKWVYSRDPNVKKASFQGFPYIVVNPATAIFGEAGRAQSVDGKGRMVEWGIEVEVVSSDYGANNEDGKGNAHNNAISDDILEVFNDSTHRQTLKDNIMFFSMPQVTSVSVEQFKETLVYRRSILLTFKTRMQVSS